VSSTNKMLIVSRDCQHYTEWPRNKCTKFNAPSFCNHNLQQNHAAFTKMLRNDQRLPVNAQFVSVG